MNSPTMFVLRLACSLRVLCMVGMVAVALSSLGGCSCNERVYLKNDTNEMLHVQIQLPKPELPWACGCKCVYETLVGPGGVWRSARPGSRDQMEHPVEAYSACAVVRARIGVRGEWARFTICGPEVKKSNGDPIVVSVVSGSHAGLDATATTESGTALGVSADERDQ